MKKKIADIQILRALAIIFVLLQHFSLTTSVAAQFPVRFNQPFCVGVELFFVISGYVVSRSLLKGEINPLTFLFKRLFRLYPVLILFIAVGIFINFGFHFLNLMPSELAYKLFVLSWEDFAKLSVSTLLGTYININQLPSGQYLFSAVWSLSVEFQFYTFVTIISIIIVYLCKQKKQVLEEFFLQTFTFLYLIVILIRIINLFKTTNIPFLSYIIDWEFDFLFLGFILSILEKRGSLSKLICFSREAALFISPWLITIPLSLMAISESRLAINKVVLEGFTLPVVGICFTLLVFISATVGSFPGCKTRLYNFLYWVGDRSYSIYLLHVPVMAFSWILIYKFCPFLFSNGILYGVFQALITILIIISLVEIVYLKVELPFIEYSQRKLT